MLKTFITAILAFGLMSPLCLCGDAVTESHSAVTKAASSCSVDHHHEHHDGEKESEHDAPLHSHSHSHSEVRLAVSDSVILPPIASFDLAEWEVVIPEPDSTPVVISVSQSFAIDAFSERRRSSEVTGVFLI